MGYLIFLIAVENQGAATLLPVLQKYVLPGTTIISGLLGAYNTVSNIGYQHLTVNHQLHFIDRVIYTTTNHIKLMQSRAKLKNQCECGTFHMILSTYLVEFMWKQKFGD